MYEKLTKNAEFYMKFAQKLSKCPKFIIFARKINRIAYFYMIFAEKCPNFI